MLPMTSWKAFWKIASVAVDQGIQVVIEQGDTVFLSEETCTVALEQTEASVIVIEDNETGSVQVVNSDDIIVISEENQVIELSSSEVGVICLDVGIPGPTGKPGNDLTIDTDANCLSPDIIGDLVYITGPPISGRLQVARVDIDDGAKMPAAGVIFSKSSPTLCVIRSAGEYTYPPGGFSPGDIVYVSATGTLSTTPPSRPTTGTRFIQRLGVALTTDRLLLNMAPVIHEILP